MTAVHCSHDTGHAVESLPPAYEQWCCACGRTRWTMRDELNPVGEGIAHGWVHPGCAQESGETGVNRGADDAGSGAEPV